MLNRTTRISFTPVPREKHFFALAAFLAAVSSPPAGAFEQQGEHKVDANTVWGINVTRGVRLSSQEATNFMTINSRDAHLNNTVAPRIPKIQSNRELLRTMPTCFDPDDPARMPWYGNLNEHYTGGNGGGGGSTIDKSAWWKFTLSITPAPNVSEFPHVAGAMAYFGAGPASINGPSLYPEGDPSAMLCDDDSPCYVYSYSFESSDPSLPIQTACNMPGVTFTRSSGLYPQVSFDHEPTCNNNMFLKASFIQPLGCLLQIENWDAYCWPELGGTYTITAHWQESSQDPPPPDGTVTHTPVLYDYNPNTCSAIP